VNTPSRKALTRWALIAAAVLVAGCASNQVHNEAMQLLAEGQRDAAIAKLRDASRLDPSNPQYRIELLNETQKYARELSERAEEARRNGDAAIAAQLFAQALSVDPANDRARRGLVALERDARSNKALAESERALRDGNLQLAQERVDAALNDNPANAAAQQQAALIRERADAARAARAAKELAASIMRKPVTLQFRDANLRMVFEALSRTTGLNVILDRDVRADLKTTIFVKDAPVEDTVDLILLQNQLEKRSLNANTLFVYPATPAKLKEYQDLQVRTFQITNADVKYVQSVLKSVLKVKDVSVDERSGTLVMRDTADAIAVASKVIAAHDVPEAEVMLEVEVLEVSHERLQNLGLEPPNRFAISTPDSANTWGGLRALTRNDLVVSPLGATINFKLADSEANLLASPRIRARNKEKARVLIGDRVPIITNSVTPVSTGSSVVTGSVQYQDVGLKLDFEPQVYTDFEVGIKISLEVSNIVKEIAGPQGSLAYQIGTRNAQTVLRLRDGETQILAGLISTEDRNAAALIPGLGHLPTIGKLFGNNSMDKKKTEIVLSITPRIVRPPAGIDPLVSNVFSGTETTLRQRPVQLDPVGELRSGVPSARAAAAAVAPPSRPATAAPAALPAPPATPSADSTAAPIPSTGAAPPAPVIVPAAPPAPEAAAPPQEREASRGKEAPAAVSATAGDFSWTGPATARVGETFQVVLMASGLPPTRSLPLTVRFDATVLKYVDYSLGSLAEEAGAERTGVSADALTGRLEVPLTFSRPEAIAGDGPLVTLTFEVKAGRPLTRLTVAQLEVKGEDGSTQQVPAGPRSIMLRISR
jgi:general secretion pathway protein D